jgi:hypothetical protein
LTRAITGTSSVSRNARPPKPPGRAAAQYSSPFACAGEHDAAHLLVPLDGRPDAHQLGFRRLVEGIHAVRPVDRHPRDVALHDEADGHDSTLSVRKAAMRSAA